MGNGTLGSPETYERVLDALGCKAFIEFQDVRGKDFGRAPVLSMPKEMDLLLEMSKDVLCADDFLSSMSGMILFRHALFPFP